VERKSYIEVYLHLVWATKRRLPLIAPEIERRLHGCISAEARRLRCEVLAVGGMPDHVHLAVSMPTVLSPAKLMQQVKGVALAFCQRTPGSAG
jgi:REP element-mobilizing transposase RayT